MYYVNAKNEKVWLDKTPAQDFYISEILTKKGSINLKLQSKSFGGVKEKIIIKMVNLMN